MSSRDEVLGYAGTHPSDISEHLLNIYDTVVRRSPNIIVELGVRRGESTFAISKAAKDTGAVLVSVDLQDCSRSCGWNRWVFIKSDDVLFADMFKSKIDVLFIDTSHEFGHTVNELNKYLPLMDSTGIIIMHDTNGTGVGHAIDSVFGIKGNWTTGFELETNMAKIINYSNNYGMAFIFLKKPGVN